jgi:hypothetical protein
MHITTIAAAQMFANKSMSKATLDPCNTLTPHKAIVLPNPRTV